MGNRQEMQKIGPKEREASTTVDFSSKHYSGQGQFYQQNFEVSHCCGIRIEKSKMKKITWENNFIENCRSITQQFQWANDMIELISNCELAKTRYFDEVNALKKEAKVEEPTETEILHTPAEVQQFKTNLKKSVIMSFSTSKPSVTSSRSQQIAGVIQTKSSRGNIEIDSASYLNKQAGRNNMVQSTKSMSVASKASFRRSIISLIDDTISSVMGNEREISRQTARDLEVFLKFSMILERHLGDINCMLGRIKRLFIVYMEKTHRDTVAASLRIGDFIDSIKQFLVILREAVIDFYNLGSFAQLQQPNLFVANDQNVLSACTAILFKDPVFYAQTFAIITHYCSARQGNFRLVLDQLKDSAPDKFMVNDRFCLNAKTIESYINSASSGAESMVEGIEFKDMITENEEPYKICKEQMRDLERTRSPISKMKAIVTCSESIMSEIERFYDKNGLKKQKWMLDADQVLSIFCYIIVGARVENLLSHLFILENFATNHQMISMSGYYLSVVNCAIEQLENEHDQLQRVPL